MPRGERFYYRQSPKVVDGTRCNDESFDVCVNGVCQVLILHPLDHIGSYNYSLYSEITDIDHIDAIL